MIIDQQAGFRPWKSTTGQPLNLTQHIEDDFGQSVVTGTVFVDLSTTNYCFHKIYRMTSDVKSTDLIENMLNNIHYLVKLNDQRNRNQKNGVPQCSVLSHVQFNIYTNDQPVHKIAQSLFYADDLCIAIHNYSFEKIESTLSDALYTMCEYHTRNNLRSDQEKTQPCIFHI